MLLDARTGGHGRAGLAIGLAVALIPACTQTDQIADSPEPGTTMDQLGGFGVVGDSNSDEYRADDARGGAFASTTFNWAELATRLRGADLGSWGSRPEPRREGYAHNWARSGATASSLLSSGQPAGAAQDVATGLVSNVVVFVGINDFSVASGEYGRIYDGSLSGQTLRSKLNDFLADVTEAVQVILSAGSPRVVVISVPDEGLAPQTMAQFPDADRRQVVSQAIAAVNGELADLAAANGVAYGDAAAMAEDLLAQVDGDGFIYVGGEPISLLQRGNEPHHFQLDDAAGHPGTVASGLLLNHLVLDPLNATYGLEIELVSDEALLEAAGIS